MLKRKNMIDYHLYEDHYNSLGFFFDSNKYLCSQIITYLGNKRNLINSIREECLHPIQKEIGKHKLSIFDGFSGSGVTSRLFKAYSNDLYVNDLEYYSYILSKCYLSNQSEINISDIQNKIDMLNSQKFSTEFGMGIIEEFYSPKNKDKIEKGERAFYTPQNAKIIDNLRRMIEIEKNNHLLLAPLLYEASVHANTSGVFKGFYKNKQGIGQFGGDKKNALERITKEIHLPYPVFSKYECPVHIYQTDTNSLISTLPEVDIAYYDPPYNEHPYGSNYFMLNLISTYKRPDNISEVAGIPVSWNKSEYNTNKAEESFINLIENTKAKFIVISYNNEGIISVERIKEILYKYGKLTTKEIVYNTFRGSRNLRKRDIYTSEYFFILKRF